MFSDDRSLTALSIFIKLFVIVNRNFDFMSKSIDLKLSIPYYRIEISLYDQNTKL